MRRDAHLFIRSLNRADDQLFASLSPFLSPSSPPFLPPDHVLFVGAAEIRIRAEWKRATDNLSQSVFLRSPARSKGFKGRGEEDVGSFFLCRLSFCSDSNVSVRESLVPLFHFR